MISLCLTHYNRYQMLIDSFKDVLDDDRVSEIIISDDCSTDGSFEKLQEYAQSIDKVSVFRNPQNLGMSRNKKVAVSIATNNWCILLDSDNKIGKDYLDSLFANGQFFAGLKVINVPCFAKPDFNYEAYSGVYVMTPQAKAFMRDSKFRMMLNTCNYVVPRKSYLEVYEYNPEHKATDTIWFNYLWLKRGYAFYVVPGMRYDHLVHSGSGFMEDIDYNLQKAKEVEELIKKI